MSRGAWFAEPLAQADGSRACEPNLNGAVSGAPSHLRDSIGRRRFPAASATFSPTRPTVSGAHLSRCVRGGLFFNGSAMRAGLANLSRRANEFGDHSANGLSKWLPCVGSLHADHCGGFDEQGVAKGLQGVARGHG